MIAITGANGQLGLLTIQHLLTKTDASNIVALVRNPEQATKLQALGVQIRHADYNTPSTLTSALSGVTKLLLISSSEVGKRAQQHQNVINAAKEAELQLFAYTSILNADTSPLALAEEHKTTEAAIVAARLPAVILRNGWYSENYTQSANGAIQAGALAGCAQNGQFNTAARSDYALAAATVLTSNDVQIGKTYELAGDESFTLTELAKLLSSQSGQTIPYTNMSQQEYTDLLVQIGLPEGLAFALADSEAHAAEGWLANRSNTLSKLIGRPTISISESLAQSLNS